MAASARRARALPSVVSYSTRDVIDGMPARIDVVVLITMSCPLTIIFWIFILLPSGWGMMAWLKHARASQAHSRMSVQHTGAPGKATEHQERMTLRRARGGREAANFRAHRT
jgi:hypothetical protein